MFSVKYVSAVSHFPLFPPVSTSRNFVLSVLMPVFLEAAAFFSPDTNDPIVSPAWPKQGKQPKQWVRYMGILISPCRDNPNARGAAHEAVGLKVEDVII